MGCDIHIMTEAKISYDDKWQNIDHWTRDDTDSPPDYYIDQWGGQRDYHLFSMLSDGVRGNMPNPIPLLGFPSDPSIATAEEYKRWGNDAHSPNHINLYDLTVYATKIQMLTLADLYYKLAIREFHESWCDYLLKTNLSYESKTALELTPQNKKRMQAYRIVFWFDN